MRYAASIEGRTVTIDTSENGHVRQVALDGISLQVDWQAVGGAVMRALPGAPAGHYSLLVGDHSYEVYVRAIGQQDGSGGEHTVEVSLDGRPYQVRVEDERTRALAGLAGATHDRGDVAVEAPMPGLVANVLVAVGEQVERGQTVVVLEAMKMENDLTAPRAGVVRALHVSKGQTVGQADRLFVVGDSAGQPTTGAQPDDSEGEG